MMRRVGKSGLTNALISQICEMIIGWDGKLTWALVIEAIERDLNLRITRQTLSQYYSIKTEFQRRKRQIQCSAANVSEQRSLDELALQKKVEVQQRKIEALEAKLNKQLDQMKTFIFNVRNIPGIDISTLLIRKDRL